MAANCYNWVCFQCRATIRYPKSAHDTPKCRECRTELFCLGYKVGVPRKLAVRGWRKLYLDCCQRYFTQANEHAQWRVRTIHAAEKEIARLRYLGPAKGRQKQIRELERRARI